MKIVSIEPTPSPNSMKLTLDESLNAGVRLTYNKVNRAEAPEYVRRLLDIAGVTGVFHTADFLAIDRHPKGDWRSILAGAREVLGEVGAAEEGAAAAGGRQPAADGADSPAAAVQGAGGGSTGAAGASAGAGLPAGGAEAEGAFGEVRVLVQTFRGIPMQVRVMRGLEQERAGMPERFAQAAARAGLASPNLLRERKLEEYGVRYGELADVLGEVVRELEAAYDEERLAELTAEAERLAPGEAAAAPAAATVDELTEALGEADWRRRYAALSRVKPDQATVPLLVRALGDPHVSVRRLATVYLGDVKTPEVLPHLFRALEDTSAAVRRTAGDTLSDIGDPDAIPAMTRALRDTNKLVRWRAARFLYEAGDDTALPALREAEDDPEFEVRMQVQLAIRRIEEGEAAVGSVWQQMTNRPKG